jgi:hypothetical protein
VLRKLPALISSSGVSCHDRCTSNLQNVGKGPDASFTSRGCNNSRYEPDWRAPMRAMQRCLQNALVSRRMCGASLPSIVGYSMSRQAPFFRHVVTKLLTIKWCYPVVSSDFRRIHYFVTQQQFFAFVASLRRQPLRMHRR